MFFWNSRAFLMIQLLLLLLSHFSHVRLLETPRTAAYQAPPSMGFSRPRVLEWGAIGCVDHNKLWENLKEMGIPDYLTCLLRNLYAGQKATVRTRHGKIDWFLTGKGALHSCILSPCYLIYMWSPLCEMLGWMKQVGIKIAGGNINNFR